MNPHIQKLIIVCVVFWSVVLNISATFANEPEHITLILNQVRGTECCDVGKLERFEHQLQALQLRNLTGSFAVRYDVLQDNSYLDLIKKYPEYEYGALLEVTPALAQAAGVTYKGTDEQWYEAQNVFLIGYTVDERKKLIDTYMTSFQSKIGFVPKFSSSWMIDPWSLLYLKSEYGVLAHQITREQFGTDSYTLYGGPVHQPYWPSDNWTLVPEEENYTQPVILRQTITDPVFNYGDRSNSYTSQPNDYAIRAESIEYFEFLFLQAHRQPNAYTFALVGLENSMEQEFQDAFTQQLQIIADWQGEGRTVRKASEFATWLQIQNQEQVVLYGGNSAQETTEKAWWINTAKYRARVRLSNGELSLTDLRVYDSSFADPYADAVSKKLGWWIVPYVLDGSREYGQGEDHLSVYNDTIQDRREEYGNPARIVLASELSDVSVERVGESIQFLSDKVLATFSKSEFSTVEPSSVVGMDADLSQSLIWDTQNTPAWGFSVAATEDKLTFTPFVSETNLDTIRAQQSKKLFPEVGLADLSAKMSYVFTNNTYAVAERNPVRTVFFPQDADGNAVLLNHVPTVTSSSSDTKITVHPQHGSNGMIFIDVESTIPLQTTVTIEEAEFSEEVAVYFAPNCTQQVKYCLTHPIHTWWYLRSLIGDKLRFQQEKEDQQARFVD